MRLILKLSKNKELIPYNYQPKLVSCIHKWLGRDNEEHGKLSLYSFSWLNQLNANNHGLNASPETNWFISFYDKTQIKKLVVGIQEDPYVLSGMEVKEAIIQETPEFSVEERFSVANPVFVKRHLENNRIKFYYHDDVEAGEQLTHTLTKKLETAGLDATGVKVGFDQSYPKPKTKGYEYNGIFNKGSICPVIVKGTPEQVGFAWNVGVGNSTGIGFGALI